ncbi:MULTISPECIES: ribosome-associated ATPase/putative transporter RbbA [unclassified Psychrobacter]|uniref:ribosome-associated ATPase/putative transporter RbbA n=1 Tax=unclassified Psychrobacter TaxID=196806 RepID=UPI0025B4CCC7|nr:MULTISPECIES: ribosome-associated ATPase/putative transporter RbbA [unclassified Psychrobacter]MDN3451936.1 ribosome-associated ATPase/putative transporter RbbA [Psychrobacter sp. APC 3350]MDN3502506.1 ribosome-associated ATPase/putative transporter RbbA [Psychrobacter sp. 5A.1]
MDSQHTAVEINTVSHTYGKTVALDNISLNILQGSTVGLIGPDGVGKSTLLSLIAGVKVIQNGSVQVFGKDMAEKSAREALSKHIAFMPQGLGHNLYPTLSVYENVEFHARLFGLNAHERHVRIARLLEATGLAPFPDRAAGKLSGGMKQKLSLCCALVHNPDLLILDEPTTGVDPLSRRQFWSLVASLQAERQEMTVIVSTAYIDEAKNFEYLLAMDDGKLLANQRTQTVMTELNVTSLEEAYIKLLPPEKQTNAGALIITPFVPDPDAPPAIEAKNLTKRFGDFTAVDNVSFCIEKGEIFGFLGSNGCGKSTTMKMLTGLIDKTEGSAKLLGQSIDANDIATKMRVGYMSQSFSLYEELSVRQNLELHATLYQIEGERGQQAVKDALDKFDLSAVADTAPASLSLGIRQRLQLAAACLHHPEVLILDEPTSGVDPGARDMFWRQLLTLSREDKITIFISTHFMNEASRCDRISFMHRGRVLVVGTPTELTHNKQAEDLEEAFVEYLLEDEKNDTEPTSQNDTTENTPAESAIIASEPDSQTDKTDTLKYWFTTVWTFATREFKELLRDKIRLFFAIVGPIILMVMTGWSISFDVHDLPYTILDQDHSAQSRQLTEYFSGSEYFTSTSPVDSIKAAEYALRSSETKLVIDIPVDYGRDLLANRQPEASFYIDGTVPFNAANIEGYVGGIMRIYIKDLLQDTGLPIDLDPAAEVVPRFMYNQDFKSVNAVIPSVLMMILMLIPAMMTTLGVVREREVGSISNLYTSPASVPQYLLGKQLPYVVLGLINYLILVLMAIFWFKVPIKGSFLAMSFGALLLVYVSTGLGLLVSSLVRTQVAALFVTAIVTLIPTINYSGLLYPLSSMDGIAYAIGVGFPASWYQRISIGGFTKGLSWSSFLTEYMVLTAFALAFITFASIFLKKQEV